MSDDCDGEKRAEKTVKREKCVDFILFFICSSEKLAPIGFG